MKKSFYQRYLKPYQDVIVYVFWGVVTTIVNLVSYHLLANVICVEYYASSIIAWILTITTTYLTNRKWVFHSDAKGVKQITIEIIKFTLSRIASLIIELILLYIGKDLLHLDGNLTKYITTFVVIVTNYVLSKVLVFTQHKTK